MLFINLQLVLFLMLYLSAMEFIYYKYLINLSTINYMGKAIHFNYELQEGNTFYCNYIILVSYR